MKTPRPCFCLPISKDGNKPGEQGWGTAAMGGLGELSCAPVGGHRATPVQLVTPSEPVASLLRNSLKEKIRFMHSNVLGNRKKHPTQFHSKSEKRHHQNTEQRLTENQPHQQLRPDFCAENASRTERLGVWLRPLQFSAAAQ